MKEKHRIAFTLVTIFVGICMGVSLASAKVVNGISVGGNRDYIGGDYAKFDVKSVDECILRCAEDQQCRVFAYAKSAHVCVLKNIVGKEIRSPGVTSGHKL